MQKVVSAISPHYVIMVDTYLTARDSHRYSIKDDVIPNKVTTVLLKMLFFVEPYFLVLALWLQHALSNPLDQAPLNVGSARNLDRQISPELFTELEELARIVDISYCVGTTGIWKPFLCASRCHEFPDFELITVRYDHVVIG